MLSLGLLSLLALKGKFHKYGCVIDCSVSIDDLQAREIDIGTLTAINHLDVDVLSPMIKRRNLLKMNNLQTSYHLIS